MFKLFASLTVGFALIANGSFAQTKLIEKVTKKGDEIVIPYEKYLLSNGLTLIIHEDHSDPIVHVDVTYHVGSAREDVGRSGFAHFFEHMLFQGSDHVADEEHFKIVTESGGTLNGSTNTDRTNYFETVPSNQLETMLWLEADRMGFFLDAVTNPKFEIQRSTVKNERGQNVDNRPYGTVSERVGKAMYPYGHPYSWSTIGDIEDLNNATLDDLKKFFLRWYGPNNATLTIGGDVNPKEVVGLVEKYFNAIPRGPEVPLMSYEPIVLDSNRYISYVDNNIRFPMLTISFPSVPNRHPDEAPLDMLSDILGGGKNSIFYQRYVKTQKAVFASVNNPCSELGGKFTLSVYAIPVPGLSLTELEKDMRDALAEFETRGVTDEDLIRYRNQFEAQTINSLASVDGKTSQLAAYQTFTGNPNQIQNELQRYATITKEDVMRVYAKYLKNQKAVVISVLTPALQGKPAQPDNFTVDKSRYKQVVDPAFANLVYTKANNESFDRSKRPVSGKAPLVPVPEFWKDELKNGLKIIGSMTNEVPVVSIQLIIKGGHTLDALDKQKAGLASLTAALMNESTKNFTSEQISVELEKLGSTINVSAEDKSIVIVLNSLAKNLDATLKLLQEKLLLPEFSQNDFDRLKKQQLEGIESANKQPSAIANNIYNRVIYGDANIYSIPVNGYRETVDSIRLDDVKHFYASYLAPNLTQVVVVGDISKEAFLTKIDFLKTWGLKPVKMPAIPKAAVSRKTKIYLMDKEKAPQSEIRIGYLTNLPFDATGEYFETYLMNYILGGAFNSRINLNLREDKGWTYGARSSFYGDEDPGVFTAAAGVRTNATDSAVIEFLKEITNYAKDGITVSELNFMKNSIGQSDARRYESPAQKAAFIGRILRYNLSSDFAKKQNSIIDKITRRRINELSRKHLPYNAMNIVVVGDKKAVRSGLEKTGYEIIEVDEKGKVIDVTKESEKK